MVDEVTLGRLAEIAGQSQHVELIGDADVVVTDLHHDSRAVTADSAFVAVRGATSDGHDYLAAALRRGSTALIVERRFNFEVPQLVVESVRPLLGPMAAEIHGHPADRLAMVGVTGTNGKTTVTHMVESMASAAGRKAAVLGTLGARIGGATVPVGFTTPEATDLHRLLRRMVEEGVDVVAMEVSSHALAFGRVDGIRFDVTGFTNLSQDHLDFHGDMTHYFATKAELFGSDRSRRAVVAVDDEWGRRLRPTVQIPVVATGVERSSAPVDADLVAFNLDSRAVGASFDVRSTLADPPTLNHVLMALGGWFNVSNAMVAWGCASALAISDDDIVTGLAALASVPGRLEPVDRGQDFAVVVDYAHTPEAMERSIDALRPPSPARIIAVGGAGGDRDRGKRPLMGAALATADVAVLTSDNPRSEDPDVVLTEVQSGIETSAVAHVVVEPDRRRAIEHALKTATSGDVVAILGKGHETGQEIAGVVTPFDDRTVAGELLEKMRASRQ